MMKVVIDGVDFSECFYRYGLTIQPRKRYGQNNSTALSGEKIIDLLAVKDVVTLVCNPLTTAQRGRLAAACRKAKVTLTYNPNGGAEEDTTMTAEPVLSAATTALKAGGVLYWTGLTLTMEEV